MKRGSLTIVCNNKNINLSTMNRYGVICLLLHCMCVNSHYVALTTVGCTNTLKCVWWGATGLTVIAMAITIVLATILAVKITQTFFEDIDASLAVKDTRIQDLEASLAVKDARIKDLEKCEDIVTLKLLLAKDNRILELLRSLEEKDARILAYENTIKLNDETFQNVVNGYTEKIAELEKANCALERSVRWKELIVEELQGEITQLERNMMTKPSPSAGWGRFLRRIK